ncbi:MAG: imidazolonepropionase [Acidobacteria bacterium]|nr:imidazolonepropionase [Acidobacteriota bacterium]
MYQKLRPRQRPSRSPQALFFRNAAQLLTLAGPPVPRRGASLNDLGIIRHGAVLTQGGKIRRVGPTRQLEAAARRLRARVIDCRGRVVMPGFVDSHTHLVFAGSRVEDFERRIRGESYEEIADTGGGIRYSSKRFIEAKPRELFRQARGFLNQFAAHGTTTVEVKTGYGLAPEFELAALAVIDGLRARASVEVVPTLLAAHALPSDYDGKRDAFLDLIVEWLIPRAADLRLAEFADCFCDRGAFSVEECRRILKAGIAHDLVPRVHAEQLSRTGATQLAVELGAASADHLDHTRAVDVQALARSNVVATLLPGANFHLGGNRYPPARDLIDAGAAVALATDFNPGTSPTLNMQFILSLACSQMRMTPAEAISAATINAAYSLRRADRLGSLEPGKQADLAVMNVNDYREIPYYFAWNHCVMTVKRGQVIYSSKP